MTNRCLIPTTRHAAEVGVSKSEVITLVAAMPEDDPLLAKIKAMAGGHEQEAEEGLLNLKELSDAVRLDPSWLYRLGVREVCGIRFAGSLRYRRSEVVAYLQSDECAKRVKEIHDARVARERNQQERGNTVSSAETVAHLESLSSIDTLKKRGGANGKVRRNSTAKEDGAAA